MTEFNTDLWDSMVTRIRQMTIANSSEHQINWNVKLNTKKFHGGQNALVSLGNMLFLRGDGVYDKQQQNID